MDKELKILIVGSEANAQALAQKFSQQKNCKIYIAPGNGINTDLYENTDIRPDDLTELLKFSFENDIDMTIPVSETALKKDIVSFFHANGQNIFGPVKQACYPILNKIANKKFLYKLHVQTPKFGIFDKLSNAQTYLETVNYPVIIRAQENAGLDNDRAICPSITLGKKFLTDILSYRQEQDILIEEFSYGENFTIYFITDGYSAIPITTVSNYKFTNEDKSGFYTDGVGCFCPNYKISKNTINVINKIMEKAIKTLENKGTPYTGILGADCTVTDGENFVINEFIPFFRNCDAQAVLNLIEDDLYEVFSACINGYFSDEYERINTNDNYNTSIVISSKKENSIIPKSENNNICYTGAKQTEGNILTKTGEVLTITQNALTLKKSKIKLKEDIEEIKFDGIKYPEYILKSAQY